MPQEINFEALRKRVRERVSDKDATLDEYIQGGCHMTYIVTLSDSRKYFVRVERTFLAATGSDCGLVSDYKMRSEVATLRFLRTKTEIPVPDVLLHDTDTDNAIGAQWMLLEYVEGVALNRVWHQMSTDARERVCLNIAEVWASIIKTSFNAIGSLYENEAGQFYVGPMTCFPSMSEADVAAPVFEKCGPFDSAQAWLEAIARRDLDYASSYPKDPMVPTWIHAVGERLRHSDELKMASSHPAARISLEHVDFSPFNILVDANHPTKIMSVIDWEAARTVPLWAMNPGFRWPDNFNHIPEQDRLKSLMRERIISRMPEWHFATGEECRPLKKLLFRAETSEWDPEIVEKETPYLFMTDPYAW